MKREKEREKVVKEREGEEEKVRDR